MFSIIIPTFRRQEKLNSLLSSLNNQTYNNKFEVIVINDDVDLLINNKNEYKFDLLIINNLKNLGPGGCRNIGAINSSCDWLVFLDDDDDFDRNKLEILEENIIKNKNVDVIINRAVIKLVDENIEYKTPLRHSDVDFEDIYKSNILGGAPLLTIKRSEFIRIGSYDESLLALEDYDLNIRIVRNSCSILFLEQCLTICYYSSREMSVSKMTENNIKALEKIISKYSDEFKNKTKYTYAWIYSSMAYKSMLIRDKKSFQLYLKSFGYNKSVKSLFLSLISFISPALIFYIRGSKK